ncbi:odorant receptor 131-2-like [Echeneis naucrates]|uniref:odorant receptor 131-2-like n=1 Tax=Echeneis naucrates TaxID=173247 RepID=UPI0011141348|nr:odorant receptor 131-2-like [Echeneis naucrates]
MTDNTSLAGEFLQRQINEQVLIVQVLVIIFLCINLLLIRIFFSKTHFYTTARYILFAVALVADSFVLFISDVLLIFSYFRFTMQIWLCVIISILIFMYSVVTPVTLTAMTLERYVAVCMPLRHGEICSTRSTVHCILIIHGISSLPCIVILSMFFVSASLTLYKKSKICSLEMFSLYLWHDHVRSAVQLLFFLIMCIIIVFSYVKIMKVAKTASGEDKQSSNKGLKTVALHGFQLLLRLIQLLCPFVESWMFHIDFRLFVEVRYFNYVMFFLAPRCLNPLIYGLRNEAFSQAMKNYVCISSFKRNAS